jgi:hypothetical protein
LPFNKKPSKKRDSRLTLGGSGGWCTGLWAFFRGEDEEIFFETGKNFLNDRRFCGIYLGEGRLKDFAVRLGLV